MKKKLLSVLCFTIVGSSQIVFGAEDSTCDIYRDSLRCATYTAFTVTNDSFDAGLDYLPSDVPSHDLDFERIDVYAGVSSNVLSMIEMSKNYAREMNDWYEAAAWNQDRLIVVDANEDRADYMAYAILSHSKIKIDSNGDGIFATFRHGQIISGNDWDNNGMIDLLEVYPDINLGLLPHGVVSVD